MKTVTLTRGKVALVDDTDYESLSKFNWHALVHRDKTKVTWYAARSITVNGKRHCLYMHRVIMGIKDSRVQVDHHNGETLDNQKRNLRVANHAKNLQNRRKVPGESSVFKGVNWHQDGKWRAYIVSSGKQSHLGLFENEKEAAIAYDTAARERFGEYALCNFP